MSYCLNESAKEVQLMRNTDSLTQAKSIMHKNGENPKTYNETDTLYNHHKCLILLATNDTNMMKPAEQDPDCFSAT